MAAFRIDSEVRSRCGGSVRVIARIEDQDIIPGKAGQASGQAMSLDYYYTKGVNQDQVKS